MPVLCPFTTKTLEEAQVGELLAFTRPMGGEFAIKIRQVDFSCMLAVLKSDGAAQHIASVGRDAECISYGSEWLFEIEQHEAFEVDYDDQERAGVACVSGASIRMRFGRDPNNHQVRGGLLDLETLQFVQQHGFSFYTRAWKLWVNARERDRINGRPLVVGTLEQ
ncbi:hypothetical protein [Ensifer aridi]|uniref:hypothetical protein n=1 Tax=Ensifer aridi TaxID=1708715 RepID=UPI000A0F97C3|nr:hypothetical protein [Ensifer aridi]